MNAAFEVGAVALRSQQQALDVIANNIANINTPGFKRSQVQFSELVTQTTDAWPTADAASVQRRPTAMPAGVVAAPMAMVDAQGQLQATGDALDIAIDGHGFVEVLGPNGQVLLWRGGALKVGDDG